MSVSVWVSVHFVPCVAYSTREKSFIGRHQPLSSMQSEIYGLKPTGATNKDAHFWVMPRLSSILVYFDTCLLTIIIIISLSVCCSYDPWLWKKQASHLPRHKCTFNHSFLFSYSFLYFNVLSKLVHVTHKISHFSYNQYKTKPWMEMCSSWYYNF